MMPQDYSDDQISAAVEAQTQKALDACKEEFKRAWKEMTGSLGVAVGAPESVIGDFTEQFRRDFRVALTPPPMGDIKFPEVAWRATRTQVLSKVRAIAALAMSHALHAKEADVDEDDLIASVRAVKPDCEITTHRLEYCGFWQGKFR